MFFLPSKMRVLWVFGRWFWTVRPVVGRIVKLNPGTCYLTPDASANYEPCSYLKRRHAMAALLKKNLSSLQQTFVALNLLSIIYPDQKFFSGDKLNFHFDSRDLWRDISVKSNKGFSSFNVFAQHREMTPYSWAQVRIRKIHNQVIVLFQMLKR